jgi:hypothetical protein
VGLVPEKSRKIFKKEKKGRDNPEDFLDGMPPRACLRLLACRVVVTYSPPSCHSSCITIIITYFIK